MKTILVPTDFSEASQNALDYAAEIAKPLKAKLILFHAYHLPIVSGQMPVNLPSEVEIEKETMDILRRMGQALHKKHGPKIHVAIVSKLGLAVDLINELVKANNIDLIVMGMQGGGLITQKLIG